VKGKVVLIMGSSSGIGRETAYRFAQTGVKLVLPYNRGKARGERAERRCRKLGAKDTLLLHLDVTDDMGISEIVKRVLKKYSRVDFLINNAGTGVFIPFKEHTMRNIGRQIRTNLEGLIKLTHAFLPYIKKGLST
jgi:short-subunit dehydrogenase